MNHAGGEAGATVLVIAGRSIDIDTAVAKAHSYPTVTVTRYDLPGPGSGSGEMITADDIARTHQVRSRISHAQRGSVNPIRPHPGGSSWTHRPCSMAGVTA
ncbi:hypothetical protein SAMN02745947_04487 [Rhodococcus rhodochrous J3]|uniref:Uncharacterized protein n=2 Tax=Rhodococcus rhodochrous TaxID=1829 RepID=A0AA46WSL5_RHORH|nr:MULTISPECIES: hypothetical protein [Rhodococcus]MDJ0400578.1 hypothetical protein [Rhodococcus rhodochrous]TWH44324.1 hypothetical protein L612_003500000010 [Rhodococcus rhodochrous J38]UZF43019.1 hypothetical protein KUM34_013920 [Rhodococcus rhodochrous]WSE20638.1 hypothetical protein U9J23_12960 [Rhodococcus sp. PD04]SMG54940.1 hypothetical protein SAMN02745947_04487 [Rhodococcus rhodochrous J3]